MTEPRPPHKQKCWVPPTAGGVPASGLACSKRHLKLALGMEVPRGYGDGTLVGAQA